MEARAAPPQCRIVNDFGHEEAAFFPPLLLFLTSRCDRCREIPSVRDVTCRGVAGMMLLHDLLHILPPLPSLKKKKKTTTTIHTAMIMRCVSAMCALKVISARVFNCALILTTPEAITSS